MIESFNAKDGKISWEPTEHASHYIFTYRPKSSSSPKQKSILTKSTEIETNILKYEEGTRTLLLNVRVYNYTSKPSDTDEEVVYPKANQLELHVGKYFNLIRLIQFIMVQLILFVTLTLVFCYLFFCLFVYDLFIYLNEVHYSKDILKY